MTAPFYHLMLLYFETKVGTVNLFMHQCHISLASLFWVGLASIVSFFFGSMKGFKYINN